MTRIVFTIAGPCVGKARHQSTPLMRGGKPVIGKGGRPIIANYTPEKTVTYEGRVSTAGQEAMGDLPLIDGPVKLSIAISCIVPASWSIRRRMQALNGLLRPTVKPDADNVLKAIGDGLNGIVWVDDVQVVEVQLSKRYADKPGAVVTVETIDSAQIAATRVETGMALPLFEDLPPATVAKTAVGNPEFFA